MRLVGIGPPGAGKSTMLGGLSDAMNIPIVTLDHVIAVRVAALAAPPRIPLSRTFIDAAVCELVAQTSKDLQRIVELPHHNYRELIAEHSLWFASFDYVIGMTAPVAILLKRNAARERPIPDAYIVECAESFNATREEFQSCFASRFIEANTDPSVSGDLLTSVQQFHQLFARRVGGGSIHL